MNIGLFDDNLRSSPIIDVTFRLDIIASLDTEKIIGQTEIIFNESMVLKVFEKALKVTSF